MTNQPYGIIPSFERHLLVGAARADSGECSHVRSRRLPPSQTPPLMDREKKIAMALSACPPSVASKAAVYVLEKSRLRQNTR